MKKISFLVLAAIASFSSFAQQTEAPAVDTAWKKIYRASATKVNVLVHKKLDVKFDYDKSYLYGKLNVTLTPHFYPTGNLILDAKGMEIKEVALVAGTGKKALKYSYDGMELSINLDKTYKAGEKYTIFIDYIAKPNELKVKGSAAITDAKGLYFINPKGEEKGKHIEIWTQGETEATSVWCPTIDRTNQRMTQELSMTVPAKYVSLSNGLLKSQKKNADGTRTDTWVMNLPHAPYLMFMGVGDYVVVKDSYKGKEVSYYVEKEYAPVARKIFGNTPEMMKFFSERLGVEYPWQKYAQIVGRDYVSGAMENTTAVLHQDGAYQNARELTDGNGWEGTIAHELFHHWFGDLVTAESWSNLTVNESFADYSQTLWEEYKYGKDAGDNENNKGMRGYLGNPANASKDLVRFKYADKEEMFDAVSYQKGGRILHMLRNYVGDEAFFKSLQKILNTHKFGTGEAGQLRLAFEDVTGRDLNWFFNQWYYGSGHPELKIDYLYEGNTAKVIIEQTQKSGKLFKLPIAVDIYNGTNKVRESIWVENRIDTFSFDVTSKPDLINVDADKVVLCVKKDNKTLENFIFQMKNAPLYMDRLEAYDYLAKNNNSELQLGLQDAYAPLRRTVVNRIAASKLATVPSVISAIEKLAQTEKHKLTKAAALSFLAKTKDAQYKDLFEKNLGDSSYSVAGEALSGLLALEPSKAYTLAKGQTKDAKGTLDAVVKEVIMSAGNEEDFDFILKSYESMPPSQDKLDASEGFGKYLSNIKDETKAKAGITALVAFRELIPEQFRGFTDGAMKAAVDAAAKGKPTLEEFVKTLWK